MAIEINSLEDATQYQAYITHRDAPKRVVGDKVYPSVLEAIEEYDSFMAFLQTSQYAKFNEETLAESIMAIYNAMLTIVTHVRAVEIARPGTFGITITNLISEGDNNNEQQSTD